MRSQYILENEHRVFMRAGTELFDGIIEAYVHKGHNWYTFVIPEYVEKFPTYEKIKNMLVEDIRLVFPDLKINLYSTIISVTSN